jgi:O-antigen ligase
MCLPLVAWLPPIPIPGLNTLNLLLLPIVLRAFMEKPKAADGQPLTVTSPILFPAWVFVIFLTYSWGRVQFASLLPASFIARNGFYSNFITFKEILVAFVLYFCARRLTVNDGDRDRALIGIVAGFSFEALTAAKEFFLTDAYRATAHLGQPNKLGHFLAAYAMIPFAFAVVGTGRLKKLGIIGLVLAAAGLLGSVSRGALLAFAIAASIVLLVRGSRWIVIAILVGATIPYWLPEKVVHRFDELSSDEPGGMTLDQLEEKEGRIRLWEAAIRMLEDNPMGVGMDLFRERLLDYGFTGRKLKTQHNTYLAVATEQGWAALAAHVWMLVAIGWRSFRLMRTATRVNDVAIGFAGIGIVASFTISMNFGDGFYENNLSGLFWIFGGIVATAYDVVQSGLRTKAS